VRREVASDEVYTRVVGYGAKTGEIAIQREIDRLEAIDDRTEAQDAELAAARARLAALRKNEYADRLKVVSDSQLSLARWGVPMADGSFAHNTYIYTDSNCTDAVFLKKQCDAIAAAVCRPTVRYQFDIAEVDATMWWDVRLGNNVLCTDDALRDVPDDPNAGESKRVTRIKRNLAGRMSCVIEIGERTNPLVDQFIATERVSRSTTGNRSKVVARTPQFTGGNYSAGDYGWYDPQTDPSTPEGTEQGIPKPYGISITAPPTKLDYMDGERIDFGGMVVQLVNQDGSIFTDSNYPDGVVPFQELILPVRFAALGSNPSRYYIDADGLMWIATSNGAAVFDGVDRWVVFTAKNSPLPQGNIYKVRSDARGNHWFGNDARGLAKLSGFQMPERTVAATDNGRGQQRGSQQPTTTSTGTGDENVRINPHLEDGYITISIESASATITFTNKSGKVVKTVEGYTNNQRIKISRLPKGMYIVGVKTVRGEKKIKFNLK
jgi:hypothetical protein